MRRILFLLTAGLLTVPALAQQARQAPPPSVPLGDARPQTPGIIRTTLKDDAKATVTRVHFLPGASEPNHTHPYDVILVAVTSGPVDAAVGEKILKTWKSGEVEFVPKDVVHRVRNTGTQPFELIAIALK